MLKLKYNNKLKILHEYDLINKFFYKNIHLNIKIKTVSSKFVINDLLSSSKKLDSVVDKKDILLNIKFFICLFFFFKVPCLIKNVKSKELKIKTDTEDFIFNYISNNDIVIFNILYLIFIENSFNIKYTFETIILERKLLFLDCTINDSITYIS